MPNPLDLVPKFVWAALVAVLAATSCKLKIDKDGLSLEVEKHATRIAELRTGIANAKADAAEQGRAMEKTARLALAAAATRERSLAADAARARDELDGLRVAVSQAERGFGLRASKDTTSPGLGYSDPFPELFLDCSRRYIDMAAKADGHASDAVKLLDSWPKGTIPASPGGPGRSESP
jgi:hypothetical protein